MDVNSLLGQYAVMYAALALHWVDSGVYFLLSRVEVACIFIQIVCRRNGGYHSDDLLLFGGAICFGVGIPSRTSLSLHRLSCAGQAA